MVYDVFMDFNSIVDFTIFITYRVMYKLCSLLAVGVFGFYNNLSGLES